MHEDDAPFGQGLCAAPAVSARLRVDLFTFLTPLLVTLDTRIDLRLVRTFLGTVEAILSFRNRAYGLLLSELGGYLLDPQRAPAGTKRLSNLLRSPKWSGNVIEAFLWEQATHRLHDLHEQGDDPLLLWDDSVQEKPESLKAEGLCSVRSSKAGRLTHVKPGFYSPPTRPIFVPGLRWLALLVIGASGPPTVAAMRWWSTRGLLATNAQTLRQELLKECADAFGRSVLHVFDRGYAGRPWILAVLTNSLRFIVRFPKRYHLIDEKGERPAWQIARGKNAWDVRYYRESHSGNLHQIKVLAFPVHHSNLIVPLWLVVARQGHGREPWYLLTTEPVRSAEDCWKIVRAYARRWQIETAFRYNKAELAMESPRLWTWERRLRLLYIVTLAYAFLLSLLAKDLLDLRQWLLRFFCHRTGKRSRETPAPLYRIRSALSRLWIAYPASHIQNSG